MYSTTSYIIDTPDTLWDEWKQLHDDYDRFNNRIVELIAMDLREHRSDDLDPGVQKEITRVLGPDGGGDGV